MKKLMILAVLCLSFIMAKAQQYDVSPYIKYHLNPTTMVFVPMSSLADNKVGVLRITVKNYEVYADTPTGEHYINVIDGYGREVRMYLGYTWGNKTYENCTMYFSKDTTAAWFFQLDRYSIPLRINLPKQFADAERVIK